LRFLSPNQHPNTQKIFYKQRPGNAKNAKTVKNGADSHNLKKLQTIKLKISATPKQQNLRKPEIRAFRAALKDRPDSQLPRARNQTRDGDDSQKTGTRRNNKHFKPPCGKNVNGPFSFISFFAAGRDTPQTSIWPLNPKKYR